MTNMREKYGIVPKKYQFIGEFELDPKADPPVSVFCFETWTGRRKAHVHPVYADPDLTADKDIYRRFIVPWLRGKLSSRKLHTVAVGLRRERDGSDGPNPTHSSA